MKTEINVKLKEFAEKIKIRLTHEGWGYSEKNNESFDNLIKKQIKEDVDTELKFFTENL